MSPRPCQLILRLAPRPCQLILLLYKARRRVVGNGNAGPARSTGGPGVLMIGTIGCMNGAAGAIGGRGLDGKPKANLTLIQKLSMIFWQHRQLQTQPLRALIQQEALMMNKRVSPFSQ